MGADSHAPASNSDAVPRLVSLTYALLHAAQTPAIRRRSTQWIRKNVKGYQGRGDEAFRKLLKRDLETLEHVGIRVDKQPSPYLSDEDNYYYGLDLNRFEHKATDFTPDEAQVLAMAGTLAAEGDLASVAGSAWTKIAAAGATRDLSAPKVYSAITDVTKAEKFTVQRINNAVRKQVRIGFSYTPFRGADVQQRSMDPWKIVPYQMRLYLVGWDVDRQEARAFRLYKVSDITPIGQSEVVEPTQRPESVVHAMVSETELVDVRLRIDPGKCLDLASQGEVQQDGSYLLHRVRASEFARTAASLAAYMEVLEPEALRKRVINLLHNGAEEGNE